VSQVEFIDKGSITIAHYIFVGIDAIRHTHHVIPSLRVAFCTKLPNGSGIAVR